MVWRLAFPSACTRSQRSQAARLIHLADALFDAFAEDRGAQRVQLPAAVAVFGDKPRVARVLPLLFGRERR